jgi:hypothetical protein
MSARQQQYGDRNGTTRQEQRSDTEDVEGKDRVRVQLELMKRNGCSVPERDQQCGRAQPANGDRKEARVRRHERRNPKRRGECKRHEQPQELAAPFPLQRLGHLRELCAEAGDDGNESDGEQQQKSASGAGHGKPPKQLTDSASMRRAGRRIVRELRLASGAAE